MSSPALEGIGVAAVVVVAAPVVAAAAVLVTGAAIVSGTAAAVYGITMKVKETVEKEQTRKELLEKAKYELECEQKRIINEKITCLKEYTEHLDSMYDDIDKQSVYDKNRRNINDLNKALKKKLDNLKNEDIENAIFIRDDVDNLLEKAKIKEEIYKKEFKKLEDEERVRKYVSNIERLQKFESINLDFKYDFNEEECRSLCDDLNILKNILNEDKLDLNLEIQKMKNILDISAGNLGRIENLQKQYLVVKEKYKKYNQKFLNKEALYLQYCTLCKTVNSEKIEFENFKEYMLDETEDKLELYQSYKNVCDELEKTPKRIDEIGKNEIEKILKKRMSYMEYVGYCWLMKDRFNVDVKRVDIEDFDIIYDNRGREKAVELEKIKMEYAMHTINHVMSEKGYFVLDSVKLEENTKETKYYDKNGAVIKMYQSVDRADSTVCFEMGLGKDKEEVDELTGEEHGILHERKKAFCKILPEIKSELEKYGIVFDADKEKLAEYNPKDDKFIKLSDKEWKKFENLCEQEKKERHEDRRAAVSEKKGMYIDG